MRTRVWAALRAVGEVYLSVYVLGVTMAHWKSARLNQSAGGKFFGLVTVLLLISLTTSIQFVMEWRLPAWIAIGVPVVLSLAISLIFDRKMLPQFSDRFKSFGRQKRKLLLWGAAALSVASIALPPLLIDSYRPTIFSVTG